MVRIKKAIRIGWLLFGMLCLFIVLCINASAESTTIDVSVNEADSHSVKYEVVSTENIDVEIISTTFIQNQICESKMNKVSLQKNICLSFELAPEMEYENVKIFILDSTTLQPLAQLTDVINHVHDYSNEWTVDANPTCISKGYKSHHCIYCDAKSDVTEIPEGDHSFNNGKCIYCGCEVVTVTFKDYDSEIISQQMIEKGKDAVLPNSPIRDGYYFSGWSDDYKEVQTDKEITAQYVKEDANNIFYVTSCTANAGDEIKVTLQLKGNVSLCGYDLKFYYDKNYLEYVDMDPEQNFDIVANHIETDSYIRLNYGSKSTVTAGGNILEITFKVLNFSNSSTWLTLEPVKVIEFDSENNICDADYSLCKGGVFIL